MSTPSRNHEMEAGFLAILQRQRAEYGRRLPASVERLAQLAEGTADFSPQSAALEELEREAHTLAGTSGTFGFVEAASAARVLEQVVARWRDGLAPGDAGVLRKLAADLRRTVR
jgi:chemotaxis protein histidine kinase CheA